MPADTNRRESSPVDNWEMDDEIDLRKYIDILIKRWREIVFFCHSGGDDHGGCYGCRRICADTRISG